MESNGVGTMKLCSPQGMVAYIFVTDVQVVVENWLEDLQVVRFKGITMASLGSDGIGVEVKTDFAVTPAV